MKSNQNEELYMLIISLKEAAIKEDNREERSPPSPLGDLNNILTVKEE